MKCLEPLPQLLKICDDVTDVKKAINAGRLNNFNSVIMNITSDAYKREYRDEEVGAHHRSFTRSPIALPSSIYQSNVIPMIYISSEIDNDDQEIRLNYERRIMNDILYAAHLRPTGPIYFKPSSSCKPFRLGKLLKQCLPNTCYEPIFVVEINLINSEYYRHMNYEDGDANAIERSCFSYWNKVHASSSFNPRIELSLVISPDKIEDENEITRWLGETIYMIVLQSECFISNSSNYPVLAKHNQEVVRLFMQCCHPAIAIEPDDYEEATICHYKDYLLFQQNFIETDEFTIEQDYPRFPLQPLKDNLDNPTYETFEMDQAKYIAYQRAIEKALIDMVPEKEKMSKEIVIMIVGAGQGPLVRSALNASTKTNRKIKIIVIEKNPNAMNVLDAMKGALWSDKNIELIFGDMRKTEYEGGVDILVSELLGSFGDNELSPECLDGVQHYLKPNGISIPCDSISYLRPIMGKRLNSNIVKNYEKKWDTTKAHSPLEVSWQVYFGSVYYIDDAKEAFTFEHPNRNITIDNSRHKALEFSTQIECVLTGFAGYFKSKLYKDIEISIHPENHTKAMRSWYGIYFPLLEPVFLEKNDRIEVAFWRKCDEKKVWYEYQLITPKESELINADGKAHPIFL